MQIEAKTPIVFFHEKEVSTKGGRAHSLLNTVAKSCSAGGTRGRLGEGGVMETDGLTVVAAEQRQWE